MAAAAPAPVPLAEDADRALLAAPRLTELFGREVTSCELDADDLNKISTLTYMRWATVKFAAAPTEQRVVFKVCKAGGGPNHGIAREGMFFSRWKELAAAGSPSPEQAHTLLMSFLPGVLFSEADMAAGSKRILMEDLSMCVQSGYFFGAGNPNNWGKDLDKEMRGFTFSPAEVTALAFSTAAKLHASFWECRPLLAGIGGDMVPAEDFSWLRASEWLVGQGMESWEASQQNIRKRWGEVKAGIADGSSQVKWSELVIECLDAVVARTSWQAYQEELKTRPMTLTHGDFHPANMMVRPRRNTSGTAAATEDLVLLDWEMVGLGSGPQDLGQFMISHVDPELRSKIERGAVEAYFTELKELNPKIAMTLEECWGEYVAGGLGRWLWFLPLLAQMCPPPMGQFFHDQVLAFMKDHGVTPLTAPMLRA